MKYQLPKPLICLTGLLLTTLLAFPSMPVLPAWGHVKTATGPGDAICDAAETKATRTLPTSAVPDGLAASPVYYFTDAALATPLVGRIYKRENDTTSVFYERSETISYLAVHPDGTLYFSNANDAHIYKLVSGNPEWVYTHHTYVRDIEFDSHGNLYFSEATGAGADGAIWRLGGDVAVAIKVFTIKRADVDEFWAGTFGIDKDDNVWLSSGNLGVANLYRMIGEIPIRVFTDTGPIMGFSFESNESLVYTDFRRNIHRLTIPGYVKTRVYEHYANPAWLSDVAIPVTPQTPAEALDAALDFFDAAVSAGTIVGRGPWPRLSLGVYRLLLAFAKEALNRGRIRLTCSLLRETIRRSDGQPNPPDFIAGAAAPDLVTRIEEIRRSLSCAASPRLAEFEPMEIQRLVQEVEQSLSTPSSTFMLEPNYPNPFNPATRIRFSVPEPATVKLVVYDVLGRQVRVLVDGALEAGTHEVVFEAVDLPSGLYLYRLETPQGSIVQKMRLVK